MKTESNSSKRHALTSDTDEPAAACELSEDLALAMVNRPDVSREQLVALSRLAIASKSRKVSLALATHPRVPRHISIPLLRRMFTFDLMQVALTPPVPADVKRAAENEIINRLKSLSAGERISLGRRAPPRVSAVLLEDSDARVLSAVLDNSRLVESSVVASLAKADAPEVLFTCVGQHPRWSQIREVQMALLKSEKTPLEIAVRMAKHYSRQLLDEILPPSRRTRDF